MNGLVSTVWTTKEKKAIKKASKATGNSPCPYCLCTTKTIRNKCGKCRMLKCGKTKNGSDAWID